MMKKVIFLDCDGVINNAHTYHEQYDGDHTPLYLINDTLLDRVKKIQQETGADIVLSSSWRLDEDGIKALKKKGLEIIDKTPYVWDKRGYEVDKWLQRHPDYYDYVILDDIVYWFLPCQQFHIIHTAQETGITDEDVTRAIDILNNSGERKLLTIWRERGIKCQFATIYVETAGWLHGIICEDKKIFFAPGSAFNTYYLDEVGKDTFIHNTPYDKPFAKTFIADSYFIFHEGEQKIDKIIVYETD